MNLPIRLTTALTAALVTVAALPASAAFLKDKKKGESAYETRKLTPAQSSLIDKSIAREQVVIKTLRSSRPTSRTCVRIRSWARFQTPTFTSLLE